MKRNTALVLIAVLAVVAIAAWYFLQPQQANAKGECEKIMRRDSNGTLTVECNDVSCTGVCILKFRKKNDTVPWRTPNDSHRFDTARWEYRCDCR